jgi:hypothetical protein
MTTLALLFLIIGIIGLLAGATRLRRMRLEEARRARAVEIQRALDERAAERRREDANAAILRSTKRIAAEVRAERPADEWEPRSRRIEGWDY